MWSEVRVGQLWRDRYPQGKIRGPRFMDVMQIDLDKGKAIFHVLRSRGRPVTGIALERLHERNGYVLVAEPGEWETISHEDVLEVHVRGRAVHAMPYAGVDDDA